MTIPERDKRMARRTLHDGIGCACIASCDKNYCYYEDVDVLSGNLVYLVYWLNILTHAV